MDWVVHPWHTPAVDHHHHYGGDGDDDDDHHGDDASPRLWRRETQASMLLIKCYLTGEGLIAQN